MRRRLGKSHFKDPDSIGGKGAILPDLKIGEGAGISGVAVKCVDIGKNTKGEGRPLTKV